MIQIWGHIQALVSYQDGLLGLIIPYSAANKGRITVLQREMVPFGLVSGRFRVLMLGVRVLVYRYLEIQSAQNNGPHALNLGRRLSGWAL